MIEMRETSLAQLETFERMASDPSRFFIKGWILNPTNNNLECTVVKFKIWCICM